MQSNVLNNSIKTDKLSNINNTEINFMKFISEYLKYYD